MLSVYYTPKNATHVFAKSSIGEKYKPKNITGIASKSTKAVLSAGGLIAGVDSVAFVRYICFRTLI